MTEDILMEIMDERMRQKDLAFDGNTEEFDKKNFKNDWVAYINAYNGRASDKVFRNKNQDENFRENMLKVAALAVAAIEAYDKGFR
jgi:hypothetical protein